MWSYRSWINNYLCNQCLSPLTWIWIPLRRCVIDITLCDKVCQWLDGFLPNPNPYNNGQLSLWGSYWGFRIFPLVAHFPFICLSITHDPNCNVVSLFLMYLHVNIPDTTFTSDVHIFFYLTVLHNIALNTTNQFYWRAMENNIFSRVATKSNSGHNMMNVVRASTFSFPHNILTRMKCLI